MRKFAMSLTAATLLVGGLAGCGVDNQAQDMGGANEIGYGTLANTDQPTTNARYTAEGPLTDMFTPNNRPGFGATGYGIEQRRGTAIHGQDLGINDRRGQALAGRTGMNGTHTNIGVTDQQGRHQTGVVGNRGVGRENIGIGIAEAGRGRENVKMGQQGGQRLEGQQGLNTRDARVTDRQHGAQGAGDHSGIVGNRPGMVDDRGILRGQGRTQVGRTGVQSHDRQTARQIENTVENMDEVRGSIVVIHGNDIVVAIEPEGEHSDQLKEKIKANIQGMAGNKNIHVVTDTATYDRVHTLNNDLNQGATWDNVGGTFTDMVDDIGRGIQRPFGRTAR